MLCIFGQFIDYISLNYPFKLNTLWGILDIVMIPKSLLHTNFGYFGARSSFCRALTAIYNVSVFDLEVDVFLVKQLKCCTQQNCRVNLLMYYYMKRIATWID